MSRYWVVLCAVLGLSAGAAHVHSQGVGPRPVPTLATIATSGSASDLASGIVAAGRLPALTGDCSSSIGTVSLSCSTLRGQTNTWTLLQSFSAGVRTVPTTVGGLATCNAGAAGLRMVVTDALTPVALAVVAAGGAVTVSVLCNGSAWIVG